MIKSSKIRHIFSLSTAMVVLAACSGGGEVANQGSAGPVTIGGGTGGGSSTTAQNLIPAGFSCPTGTSSGTATTGSIEVTACVIPSGTITADLTLPGTSGGQRVGYALQGSVFVGDNTISNPSGSTATLTIEAGAILFGQQGEDALFVSPGSRIFANGTATNPIVMTSIQDLSDGNPDDGQTSGGATARGQWGGLVISGLAPINDCDVTSVDPVANPAACNKTGEGGSGLFGGSNPNDNSGVLNYVRIQYAGFLFNSSDELNGIAFQGVGDATDVDFIQVHNNADDGVEFFGGRVDASHVIITAAGDDSIDWTDGWQGDLQFALVVQDDVDGDKGIEGDNRSNDVDIEPRSNPNISNFTFFGGATGDDGIRLRAGTNANIANGIVIGFGDDGVDFRDDSTLVTPTVGSLFLGGNDGLNGISGSNVTNAAGNTMSGIISGAAEQAVTATDPTTLSAGFDAATYLGAFNPDTETNASNWTTGWSLGTLFPDGTDEGCPVGTAVQSETVPAGRTEARICILPNEITSDLRLTNGNLYSFIGSVFVGTDAGPDGDNPVSGAANVTLTIDPGVTLFGRTGEDAIIVARGSQIQAAGTATAPIVMTSEQDILGETTARGQWGGLVINGRAPINDCDVTTVDPVANPEQCEKTGEGFSGQFGGNVPEDNSGTLNYVVVKNAGFRFSSDDELNGIAFQGVGSATDVDYIQVDNNADDGVEFFGGTVNAKHIVLTSNGDDSLDFTDGWTGSAQYVIIKHASDDGDNGIEGDNRSNDTDILPRSNPTIANVTFLGDPSTDDGATLRAGLDASIYNMIITGAGDDAIDFNQNSTQGVFPDFFCSYIVDNATGVETDDAGVFTSANGNVDGDALGQSSTLTAASDATATVVPGANEQAVSPCFPSDNSFIDSVSYIGAVENASDNWYKGWTFGL